MNQSYQSHLQIYKDLLNLCDESELGFHYADQINQSGTNLRIFGYHFASYSEWLKPNALEARGITFDITDENNPKIVCWPMRKFFNLNENPFTSSLDLTQIEYLMDKADGSLISFYFDKEVLSKSKMALYSDQAIASLELLKKNPELYAKVEEFAKNGYTLNFEYVGPSNRVVIFYDEPKLILLNIRNNVTGEYYKQEQILEDEVLSKYLVKSFDTKVDNPQEFIENVLNSKDIEGYVGILKDGTWFKLKTYWYAALHKTKDGFNTPESLLVAIANDTYDDLYSLCSSDNERAYVDKALKVFLEFLEESLHKIFDAYSQNKDLTRKEYAISGNKIFANERYLFGIYMSLFEKEFDKEVIIENLTSVFIKYVDNFSDRL